MLRSRGSRRLLVAVAIAMAPAVGGCSTAAGPSRGESAEAPSPAPTASISVPDEGPSAGDRRRADRVRALAVLREWDLRRAVAFAEGDVEAVRRLYVLDAGLARQDVAVMRDYARRGARVTALVPQVVSARVRVSSGQTVELVVVERVAVAEVSVAGQQRALAGSRFARHALRFVREQGEWRLSSARGA